MLFLLGLATHGERLQFQEHLQAELKRAPLHEPPRILTAGAHLASSYRSANATGICGAINGNALRVALKRRGTELQSSCCAHAHANCMRMSHMIIHIIADLSLESIAEATRQTLPPPPDRLRPVSDALATRLAVLRKERSLRGVMDLGRALDFKPASSTVPVTQAQDVVLTSPLKGRSQRDGVIFRRCIPPSESDQSTWSSARLMAYKAIDTNPNGCGTPPSRRAPLNSMLQPTHPFLFIPRCVGTPEHAGTTSDLTCPGKTQYTAHGVSYAFLY